MENPASKPYLNPITIHDPVGEAYRMCQMGAREMMIRELTKNAFERVTLLPSGQRLIRLYGANLPNMPVQKLGIWNRGGMDLPLLKTFSQINVQSKRVSVDANFGRGAKIASLMSNMLGMRFRSCTNGRVYEVQLAVDPEEKTVGRIEFADAIPGESFIRDVTKEYQAGRGQYNFLNTNTDWTEVVLLGNEPDQDTTAKPYLDLNLPESKWLWNAIGMRFFNVPDGIDLSINSKITRYKAHGGEDGHWYRFYPMMQTMQYAHRHECVPFDGGQIWYIQPWALGYGNGVGEGGKDPTRRRFASTHADRPFGGVLWRDEIHNLHYGTGRGQTVIGSKSWPQLALRWGLVRSYSHVCILVELNHDEANNDINRVQLVGRDGVIIDPELFSDVVRENMPEWVKEIERSLAPREDESARNIREYLRQLMRDFENLAASPVQGGEELGMDVEDEGQGDGVVRDGTGGRNGKRIVVNPDRQPNATRRKRPREVPNAEWVDEKWFAEHNAAQMACQFSANAAAGTSTLYFNRDHMIFRDLKQRLADKAPDSGVPEVILDIAEKHAKAIFYKVAGTHVVGAFSLDKSSHIAQEQIDQALLDIVLTGVLATARCSRYFLDHVSQLRLELRQRLYDAASA